MGHDPFENRQVTLIDEGAQVKFSEHDSDDVRFIEKVIDDVEVVVTVEDKDIILSRGPLSEGEELERFIYDHVIEPKFNTQDELIDWLFDTFEILPPPTGGPSDPIGVAIFDSQTGARAIVDQNGAIKFGEAIILAGDVLYGQDLSPILWVDLPVNNGNTVGAPGEQRLNTGTDPDGEVILQSRKVARFMISQFNIAHWGVQLDPDVELLDPNLIIEWGCVDFIDDTGVSPVKNVTPNGIFFRVQGDPAGPIWSIVNVKDGVENETMFEDWNGVNLENFVPDPTLSVYEIQYNAGTALFFQGSNFVHRLLGLTETYAATYHFPVVLRIRNINGSTNDRSIGSRAAGIYRLGEERGELISRAFTADTLVKTGAGYIGKASLSRTGSSGGSGTAQVYDGIDATGILIGRIDVGGDDVKGISIDGTYSRGIYITIAGSGTNTLTINFE